jgi:hypothetical protein
MDHEDSERRIAELERQLADAKAAREEEVRPRLGDRGDAAALDDPRQQPYQAEQDIGGNSGQFGDVRRRSPVRTPSSSMHAGWRWPCATSANASMDIP